MDELRRLTELVVNQVSHWAPGRWAGHGDALYEIIQRIAGPAQIVPRLGDTALPDQLRVVVADLLAEGDDAAIQRAIKDLNALRGTLKAAR